MAEPGQMPKHGMNGFVLFDNLFISSTSKLYKYMQHTSWPTVCGTNTRIVVSFFLICLVLQNVHATWNSSRFMLFPLLVASVPLVGTSHCHIQNAQEGSVRLVL